METKPPISAISASRRKSHRYLHSPVTKHSITLVGHKTSVTLENQFWDGLQEIAHGENVAVSTLIERIDIDRNSDNLSSAIRLYVLDYFKTRGT
jgi:predicted DNA-binding ribbon-helix-helix protein